MVKSGGNESAIWINFMFYLKMRQTINENRVDTELLYVHAKTNNL
jgi:hypothetical protein